MQRPIIALDFPDKNSIATFLAHFPKDEHLFLKVGMELFYQEGPSIVTWLRELGHDIFLDLKLHDIPNTVERAMRGIGKLGVRLTNVHAAGGGAMMEAARKGLNSTSPMTQLIAVTQLTSTSEKAMQHDQGLSLSLIDSVTHYAQMAQQSGLDGVVCSALEVPMIKKATTLEFKCLTPGIRPQGANVGDQKRVVTPQKAKALGSDMIVVGRPITQSPTPYQTYLAIKKEWSM